CPARSRAELAPPSLEVCAVVQRHMAHPVESCRRVERPAVRIAQLCVTGEMSRVIAPREEVELRVVQLHAADGSAGISGYLHRRVERSLALEIDFLIAHVGAVVNDPESSSGNDRVALDA